VAFVQTLTHSAKYDTSFQMVALFETRIFSSDTYQWWNNMATVTSSSTWLLFGESWDITPWLVENGHSSMLLLLLLPLLSQYVPFVWTIWHVFPLRIFRLDGRLLLRNQLTNMTHVIFTPNTIMIESIDGSVCF
jgi:hypothetical protein